MNDKFWHKQTKEPLFGGLLWSRPENKIHAGKLLIIGGNAHGFSSVAQAYAVAEKAGAGSIRVILPDHVRKQIPKAMHQSFTEFAPSTPSGSFSKKALAELMADANWSDAVLVPGDLGRNSETAILLESFIAKTNQNTILTKDAVDYYLQNPSHLSQRDGICLVLSLAQLQKLGSSLKQTTAITFGMNAMQLAQWLHDFTAQLPLQIIVKHSDNIFVASSGEVSTTSVPKLSESWRVETASTTSVWIMQNPSKPFEAATTAIHTLNASS